MSVLSQASDLIYKHSATWEELWRECDGVPDKTLQRKLNQDTWSVLEIIEHCLLAEELFLAALNKAIENPKPPSLIAKIKPAFISLAMKLPTKVKIPMETVRPQGKETLSSLKSRETAMMAEWNRLIDTLDEEAAANTSVKHPIFGTLNLLGVLSFIDDHLQRHLRQLQERKKALSGSISSEESPSQAANL